jgi:ubiquitin-conjugating enzyme E2 D/E
LQKSPLENVTISIPDETNISLWSITIIGPTSTPYANGIFTLSFTFPTAYPFKPPIILFTTKIYHPNIHSTTGEICSNILYDDWGPTLNVRYCLETIYNLLVSPNIDSPLEEEIAKMLRENPGGFDKIAKKWTKEHAK